MEPSREDRTLAQRTADASNRYVRDTRKGCGPKARTAGLRMAQTRSEVAAAGRHFSDEGPFSSRERGEAEPSLFNPKLHPVRVPSAHSTISQKSLCLLNPVHCLNLSIFTYSYFFNRIEIGSHHFFTTCTWSEASSSLTELSLEPSESKKSAVNNAGVGLSPPAPRSTEKSWYCLA